MSEPVAIAVEHVGKCFRLGSRATTDRFTERLQTACLNTVRRPWQWLQGASRPTESNARHRDEYWALDDISFEVRQGEALGIVGRNGAGKSTLLKILTRITEPTRGRFGIRGRVASLLEVGTGFHPDLTGRENIYLSGSLLGLSRQEIRRRFDEIAAFAEIDAFIDTPVKRYSSGMYTRLGFAVAAHLESEVLIVDEVLAVGDAQFQRKCLGKMHDVAAAGRTVLFVSHNAIAVRSLCDRVLLLDQGRSQFLGPTSQGLDLYVGRTGGPLQQRTWPTFATAPGSERVRLHSVRINLKHDRDGVGLDEPFGIELTYWIQPEPLRIHPSLLLSTTSGVCVLNSAPSTLSPEPLSPGLHTATCEVPGGLLNNGDYRISVVLVRDGCECECRLDDLLEFTVHDTMPRAGWFGEIPGVVRPQLVWECVTREEFAA